MAFEFRFITEPDDSLKCLICLEVATDPKQHGSCGKLFCSECIEKNGKNPCPNCRVENPQYFKDTRSLREAKALLVRCDGIERGCIWEGSAGALDNHMTKCEYTLVSCPSGCKTEDNDGRMMKKDLDEHLKTKCPNRKYKCENCQKKGTYASITKSHDSVCIRKIVSCPNAKCTSTMERGVTKTHLQTSCSYTVVACKYASIGCLVKTTRLDMKQHEEESKSHLPLTLRKIEMLDRTLSLSKNEIASLRKRISSLVSDMSSVKAATSSLKVTTSSLKDVTSSQKDAISSLEDISVTLDDSTSFLEDTTSSLKDTTSSHTAAISLLKDITTSQEVTISSLEGMACSQKASKFSQKSRISSLEVTTTALKDNTSALKVTISSLEATTSALKATSTSQKGSISSLVSTTSSQMAKITSLNAATSSLKDASSSQKSTISSLKATTSALKATTSSQMAKISSLNAATSALMDTTSSLKVATSSQQASISSLVDTTSVLKKDRDKEKWIIFNLPKYSRMKEECGTFYSELFYSSPGGYRMCIRIDPRGTSDECTHVSVFSQLLEGPYDDDLPWPFLGSVTVELLNQLTDACHHSKIIPFNSTHNTRAGSAWGYDKFVTHGELSYDSASNTQYLMNDTLYFRVTVEVDNHKPWLDCTHHSK